MTTKPPVPHMLTGDDIDEAGNPAAPVVLPELEDLIAENPSEEGDGA